MFGFTKKDPRNYERQEGRSGPMEEGEYERAFGLIKDLGTEKKRGFFIIAVIEDADDTVDGRYSAGDGMMKMTNINMMSALDAIQQSVGMNDEDLMKYLLAKKLLVD